MGLLAHQVKIVDTIKNNFITSISAPRQNGKTYAAIAAAVEIGGRTLFVSRGYAGAKEAFRVAEGYSGYNGKAVVEAPRSNGDLLTKRADGGSIRFIPYGKASGRGLTVDTVIFDDADSVERDILEAFYPAVFAALDPRIVALSLVADRGLAAHLADQADAVLVWSGEDEARANPGFGELVSMGSLEHARRILPDEIYRRECLGLST